MGQHDANDWANKEVVYKMVDYPKSDVLVLYEMIKQLEMRVKVLEEVEKEWCSKYDY